MKLSRLKVMYSLVSLWIISSVLALGFFMTDQYIQDKINTLNHQVMIAKELLVIERDSLQRQNDRLSELLSQIQSEINDLSQRPSWFYLGDTLYFRSILTEYIDDIEMGNAAAIEIHKLLIGINDHLESDSNSERATQLISDVKATIFYALFSGHQNNSTIYRRFDHIFLLSQQLDSNEQVAVQKILSLANKLLEKEASLSHAVSYLNSFKLENEFSHLHRDFIVRTQMYIAFYGLLSLTILCALLFIASWTEKLLQKTFKTDSLYSKRNLEGDVKQKLMSNNDNQNTTLLDSGIELNVLHNSMNGDVEAMKLLLGIFIQEHQNDSDQIRSSINNDQLAQAQHSAHSLKGVAGSIGAKSLRDIAFRVEKKLRNGDIPTEQDLQQLDIDLAKAMTSANYHLGKLNQ